MKTKISIKPVYFYKEEQEIINELNNKCVNFQKLVKSLLWKWVKEQEGK